MNQSKLVNRFVIGTFVTLYLLVSTISTIHVIDFFEMSNPYWLAVTLAIAFEVGAAASLASLVVLDKMNKGLIWALFIAITLMQMQGNMYYAFKNLNNYQSWVELFNLVDEDPLYQKRILSFVSGAILPLVALGFIKSLVDYIKPDSNKQNTIDEVKKEVAPEITLAENAESMRKVVEAYDDLKEEMDEWEKASLEDLKNMEDLIDQKSEIEEEKAKIEEMIETEAAEEESIEEMITEVMEKEESLESKIEEVTEDMTNDYLFGKQIFKDAVNKAAKTNAILNARKAKIEASIENEPVDSVENSIEAENSIIEEEPTEREIRKPKMTSTGAIGRVNY